MCTNTVESQKDTEKGTGGLLATSFDCPELRSLALLRKGFAAETPCRWDKALAEAAKPCREAPQAEAHTFILANRWHGTKPVTEHLRTFLLGDFLENSEASTGLSI